MTDHDFYFLVGGTNEERHNIANERGLTINSIRMVNRKKDILGFRGGKIIFGNTGVVADLEEIIDYANTHGIEIT